MTSAIENGESNLCDVVQQMANFNYEAPIQATVIFYDSDEDVKTSIENNDNHEDVDKKKDDIVTDVIADIHPVLDDTEHEIGKSNPKRRRLDGPKSCKKRKLRDGEETVASEYYDNQDVLIQNQAQNSLNHAENLRHGYTVISESSRTQALPNTMQCNDGENPQRPQLQDESNTANECLKSLLATLSSHMVVIMKAYVDYLQICKTADKNIVGTAKRHYLQTKRHFFYLSYSAVANILVPHEKEEAYIKNFIDDTVRLAHKELLFFTYSQMRALLTEMIGWVKTYRQRVDITNAPYKNPILTGMLQNRTPSMEHTMSVTREQQYFQMTNRVAMSQEQQWCNPTSTIISQEQRCYNPTNTVISREQLNYVNSQQSYNFTNNSRATCIYRHGVPEKEPPCLNLIQSMASNQTTMHQGHFTNQNLPLQSLPSSRPNFQHRTRGGTNVRNYMQEFQDFNSNCEHHPSPLNSKRKARSKEPNQEVTIAPPGVLIHQETSPMQSLPSSRPNFQHPTRAGTNVRNYMQEFQDFNSNCEHHPSPSNSKRKARSRDPNQEDTLAPPGVLIHQEMSPLQGLPSYRPNFQHPTRGGANVKNFMQVFQDNSNCEHHPSPLNSQRKVSSKEPRSNQEVTIAPPGILIHQEMSHNDPPPPYTSPTWPNTASLNQITAITTPHCNPNFQQDMQVVVVNRSLSRDSGFMSPLSTISNDTMYSPRHEAEKSTPLTPMITHVTSLNPTVEYIKDGQCHVCCKPTKLKCVGCFLTYYCSYRCQADDWKIHMNICNK